MAERSDADWSASINPRRTAMKKGYAPKASAIAVVVILFSALTVTQAFGWGSAVHAYIDDHLGRKGPVRNLNEIYGAMAPDVFNSFFQTWTCCDIFIPLRIIKEWDILMTT